MQVLTIEAVIKKLKEGRPIIFQPDTLPAIGCLPNFSKIIYEVKKRDKNKALILMGAEITQIVKYVNQIAVKDLKKIAAKYWPGPLTIVVPISDDHKLNFISTDNTVGIRIPNSSSAKKLINETGPLATSSANISGLSPSFNAHSVAQSLPNVDILGPIPWEVCSGKASTIISWIDKGKWKLIRKGEISIIEV